VSARTSSVPLSQPRDALPLLRRLYAFAAPLAAALALWHAARLLDLGAASASTALAMVVACALGVVAADGLTGVVHWACDTWGSERTPVLGATLIRAFRAHHVRPGEMVGHDWIEVNGEAAAAAGLALAALALPAAADRLDEHPAAYALLWSAIVCAGLTNQLHQWAHTPRPARGVRWLQRAGLVLSPRRHARHHRGEHLVGYCITTGWANPLLDAIGFWRALERAITAVTGARARGAAGADDAVDCPSPIPEER